MTPLHAPRAGLAATLLACLLLTACGDDEPATTPATSSTDDAGSSTGTDGTDGTDSDTEALEEGFDDALASSSLESVADAIESTLGATGYEIDDDGLTFGFDGAKADGGSHCAIIQTVVASFEEATGTPVTLEYDDGTTTCEPLG